MFTDIFVDFYRDRFVVSNEIYRDIFVNLHTDRFLNLFLVRFIDDLIFRDGLY